MNYDYTTTYGNTYDTGVLAGASLMATLISLAVAVFSIVILWKIFEKAGKEGWRAIVPFYNVYTLFEITWGNGWYFLLIFLAIIPILGYIAVFVILIMTYLKLAKAFGKSSGFGVGMIFLSIIFMAILAFDSSTYLGVPNKENNANPGPVPTPAPTAVPTNNNFNEPQPMPQVNNVNPNPVSANLNNNVDTTTPVMPTPAPAPTVAPQPQQPVKSFCPNCGTELAEGVTVCPNCGTPKAN